MHTLARPVAARIAVGGPSLGIRLAASRSGPGLPGLGRARQPQLCLRVRGPARLLSSTPARWDDKKESKPAEPLVTPAPSQDTSSAPKDESISNKEPEQQQQTTTNSTTAADGPSFAQTAGTQVSVLKERFSELMDRLQNRALDASHTMNDLTGYSAIEAIKAENAGLEQRLADAHAALHAARQTYKTSNARRAATQREVTTLLARKESWTPVDLERFTELYRTDHVLEGEVSAAHERLTDAEVDEQALSQRLNSGILKRYHEEQIWSDKIRRASTWGTWGLMGMNFLLFIVLQFVAEPWKRKRLVTGVVAQEKEALAEVRTELALVKEALAASRHQEELQVAQKEAESQAKADEVLAATAEVDAATPTTPADAKMTQQTPAAAEPSDPAAATPGPLSHVTWRQFLVEPARWTEAARDLCSDRLLYLRVKDVSAVALEGAVVGAATAGSIAWMLARRT